MLSLYYLLGPDRRKRTQDSEVLRKVPGGRSPIIMKCGQEASHGSRLWIVLGRVGIAFGQFSDCVFAQCLDCVDNLDCTMWDGFGKVLESFRDRFFMCNFPCNSRSTDPGGRYVITPKCQQAPSKF